MPLNSMTGFGRGTASAEQWEISVEVSSVNQKTLALQVNLPRELSALERPLTERAKGAAARGKVTVSVRLQQPAGAAALPFDDAVLDALLNHLRTIAHRRGLPFEPNATTIVEAANLASRTAASSASGPAAETLQAPIEAALDQALAQFAATRRKEGEALAADLLGRIATLRTLRAKVATEAPSMPAVHRENLLQRLRQSGLDLAVDDERVLKEIALFADRCDVSEELTRLDSHFSKFREYLQAAEPPGRALDFLCQELFREFNTIGSKANDAGIAQVIVEAKTELEKIREQVQNVE